MTIAMNNSNGKVGLLFHLGSSNTSITSDVISTWQQFRREPTTTDNTMAEVAVKTINGLILVKGMLP